jgi:chemotaxis protein histidine kinase CheA
VYREVCAHGGRLQFDSQPGHGTTVRVDLPAALQSAIRGGSICEGADRHPPRRIPT